MNITPEIIYATTIPIFISILLWVKINGIINKKITDDKRRKKYKSENKLIKKFFISISPLFTLPMFFISLDNGKYLGMDLVVKIIFIVGNFLLSILEVIGLTMDLKYLNRKN